MTAPPTHYADHRARFHARLSERGVAAVIPTATEKTRNHDSTYRFRPTSDFWYLTGFGEPEACLVLLPATADAPAKSVLFLRERDPERETWDGRRLGVERAAEALGVDEARDIEDLWTELPKLLKGQRRIMWRFGQGDEQDARMVRMFTALRDSARGATAPTFELLDPAPILHEMRLIKGAPELELMRRAAHLTANSHAALMAHVRPGRNECEAHAFLDHAYRRAGATGAAYEHICAGGANACILHYVENDQPLKGGELILVDSGAEWDFYAADITRTFPVNGRFSDPQRTLYEIVLNAELAAIAEVRPGVSFTDVHDAALRVIIDGLIEVGILSGERDELIEGGDYRPYFMHKTSHWLGLDVHDCGAYFVDGEPRALEPGMVLTVEPGLYVPEDAEVDPRWRGIGIRIEDDVLVTPDGNEVLTADAPKTVEDVEAACAGQLATGATVEAGA